jgi:membrane protease YdiL (CAAX protease family)
MIRPEENPNSPVPEKNDRETGESMEELAARIVVHSPAPAEQAPLQLEFNPPALAPASNLPDDLRISWGWLHFLGFVGFVIASLVITQLGAVFYLMAQTHNTHMSQKELQQLIVSRPQILIAAQVVLFGMVIFFLYITLAVLRDKPFWRTLGWQKLSKTPGVPVRPLLYFMAGVALSLGVAGATYFMKPPENLPIEDLLKSRTGAMLLISMAVLVAPLVEETTFRGYLYPLFASSFTRAAEHFGHDSSSALRIGSTTAILLTGTLFGLLHGAQLGWTWGLVAVLVSVGIIFTFVRARTGTVLASFLLHLGYNSMIGLSVLVSTHGFTRMPPHP